MALTQEQIKAYRQKYGLDKSAPSGTTATGTTGGQDPQARIKALRETSVASTPEATPVTSPTRSTLGTSVSPETTPKKDGFLKSIVKDPIKTLLVKPAVNLGQAIGSLGIEAFGSEETKARAQKLREQDTEVDLPFLGKYNIEKTKKFGEGGAKQIVGEGLKSASYLYGGKGAEKVGEKLLAKKLGGATARGAGTGFVAGGLYGAGSGLEENQSTLGVATRAGLGAALGTVLGGGIPLVAGGGNKALRSFQNRGAVKAEEKALLASKAPDSRVATKSLTNEGKVVSDDIAKEAVKQGIPEADVALVKSATPEDKSKMLKMLDLREKQLTNKRFTDRATDVAGETFMTTAKHLEKTNKEAAKRLDQVALSLAGKKVDSTPALQMFGQQLETQGITLGKNGMLNYKGSNFENLPSVQKLINEVWRRALKVSKTQDGLQLHRTKTYIDEIVDYGKVKEGLSGRAQRVLKNFRHEIDAILDANFANYNKANTKYSDTIKELDKIAKTLKVNFKAGEQFANTKVGVALRRVLGNAQSRADILQLIESTQLAAQKYGYKSKEDVVTQTLFADTLEKLFGTEAPTSFLGQVSRGLERFGSTTGVTGPEQASSAAAEFARGHFVRGALKGGTGIAEKLMGVSQEARLKALRELIGRGLPPAKTVFGKKL